MEYILGTVQLGLSYGINNKIGKPSDEEAFSILSCAYDNNIIILDTANKYGDSERIIGNHSELTGKKFKICAKYSGENELLNELNETLEILKTQTIYMYYLHKFDSCKNNLIINKLINQKTNNVIKYIGVSVYTPEEMNYIIMNLADIIDIVQIPFNIFDCTRWIELIKKAKSKGVKVVCRSVFLQGVLFKSVDDKFIKKYNAQEYIYFIQNLCNKYKCTAEKLAISFCNSYSEISGLIFGCESKNQLLKNIETFKNLIEIEANDKRAIIQKMNNINLNIIDPRLWG